MQGSPTQSLHKLGDLKTSGRLSRVLLADSEREHDRAPAGRRGNTVESRSLGKVFDWHFLFHGNNDLGNASTSADRSVRRGSEPPAQQLWCGS